MTSFTIKRASKKITVLLDLTKAAEIEELADQLADMRAQAKDFESEASGVEERRLVNKLDEKHKALTGGADTLVLEIHGISASQYEQVAIQSRHKVEGKIEVDIVKLVKLVLKASKVTATVDGETVDFTDKNIDELIDSAADWQIAEIYSTIVELNLNGSAPKAALQRASTMTRS